MPKRTKIEKKKIKKEKIGLFLKEIDDVLETKPFNEDTEKKMMKILERAHNETVNPQIYTTLMRRILVAEKSKLLKDLMNELTKVEESFSKIEPPT